MVRMSLTHISYIPTNIKPTNSSLMEVATSPTLGFGLVNEMYLQKKLDLFSGNYSDNITEKDGTTINSKSGFNRTILPN